MSVAGPSSGRYSAARAWFALAVLHLLYVVSFIDRGLPGVLIQPLKADLGLSDTQFGLLVGGPFAIFYAALAIPIGTLVDRRPRRLILGAGLTLWSLAAAACGLAATFVQLLLARLWVAVGEASLSPSASSLLPDLFKRSQLTLATALFTMGGAIGSALALILGGMLLHSATEGSLQWLALATGLRPWQLVFVLVGLSGLPLLALVWLIREPSRTVTRADGTGGVAELLEVLWARRALYGPLFVGFAAAGMTAYSVYTWTPAILMRQFDLSARAAGQLSGLVFLGGAILGSPLIGGVTDRWLRHGRMDAHYRVYILAALIGIPGLLVALLTSNYTLLVPALILYSVLLLPHGSLAFASIQLVTPPLLRGRVSAAFLLTYTIVGLGVGPVLVGWFTDNLFADEARVGHSLVVTILLASGVAVGAMLRGAASLRRAIADHAIDVLRTE